MTEVTDDIYEGKTFTVPAAVLFPALDALRLAHIYALKDSHPEELPEDFKKYKWDGYEVDFALESSAAYRRLLNAMIEDDETRKKHELGCSKDFATVLECTCPEPAPCFCPPEATRA